MPSVQLVLSRTRKEKLKEQVALIGGEAANTNRDAVLDADVVIVAVKPSILAEVMKEISEHVKKDGVVISVVTGKTIAFMKSYFQGLEKSISCVRVMPNIGALVSQSATGFATDGTVSEEHKKIVKDILGAFSGCVVEVLEPQLDAVTGVSGSGIAYILLAMEAMIEGGVKVGLSRSVARDLVIQSAFGAARLAKLQNRAGEESLATIREKIITPGGTTAEGLFQLEKRNVRATFSLAVEKAAKKSAKLSKVK
ncbi:hypothetical protein CHS0354_024028 [Potamilus streckersoni]|uniref:Pyrroline-5-carboxylate reductase 3 n=1 Tax=Potamilus streckersoni TaxID=2493646 RepID=A0AAE0VLZ0_9BIVA|nr:hypothetical protein CHS0354_024028 [Potamilus streckersoni]